MLNPNSKNDLKFLSFLNTILDNMERDTSLLLYDSELLKMIDNDDTLELFRFIYTKFDTIIINIIYNYFRLKLIKELKIDPVDNINNLIHNVMSNYYLCYDFSNFKSKIKDEVVKDLLSEINHNIYDNDEFKHYHFISIS